MKSRIAGIALFLILLHPIASFSGIGVEHDGSGNIVRMDKDANPSAFTCENCVYYSVPNNTTAQEYAAIKALKAKYSKWDGGPVEMTAQEKADKDAADEAKQTAAEDAAWNAMIDQAKAKVDAPNDEDSLIQECTSLKIIAPEIRAIKSGSPRPGSTDSELKLAVKACLDALKK